MTAIDPGPILVDGDARSAIEHDLDRNLFVEAGAGTGKTTVLVRRVVRLFATARLPDPSGLVAITFTEAAAAELRERIRTELERSAAGDELAPVERARCLDAAHRIDEAVITTVHGFAQRILAEHPVEAGLPPAFEIEEGIPAELAFAARWQAFVDDLFARDDLVEDLRSAITLGLPLWRLRELARLFSDRWDRVADARFVDPGPAPDPDPGPIVGQLRAAVDLLGDRRGSGDKLADAVEAVEVLLGRLEVQLASVDRDDVLRALDALDLPAFKGRGTAKVWGRDKDVVIGHLAAAEEARLSALDGFRRHLLGRLLPLVAEATVRWAEERAAAGRLQFHDLLVLARRLLWRPDGAVRRLLAERYRVLLVDEFQDTDPVQVELVVALAAADPAAPLPARWQDVELGAGRVVVVGDPKQSIYGFRGADVTLWRDVQRRFASDVVTLSQNFRSVPPILGWVNQVFGDLMPPDEAGPTQPAYVELDAARDGAGDVLAFGGPGPEGMRAAEIRLAEAADVAAAMVELRAGGVRHADIALLLPTRTPLGALERALDEAGVPYRVESRSLVWGTDVVRELLAVLGAVEDPADEVAVVAALRSPAFACRDDELLDFRRAGGSWDPTAPPPPALDPSHPVVAGMGWLAALHGRRWWMPVNEVVDLVIRERRLVELCFAHRRPRDHWRRLRFVADQARAFVEAGGRSLAEFLTWAAMQLDEGALAVETVVAEPDDDAVRILTVHGAKGLEFPVVVLAGLTASTPPTGTKVLWTPSGVEVRVSVPRHDGDFTTAGYAAAAEETKQADLHESIRLLYVAATRARDRLLVSVHHKHNTSGTHAHRLHQRCEALGVNRRARIAGTEPVALFAPPELQGPAPEPLAADEREALRARLDAVAASSNRPWAVAPTALGHDTSADPATEELADDDSAPPVAPGGLDGEPEVEPRRGGTAIGRAVHGVLERVDLAAAGAGEGPGGEVGRLAAVLAAEEGVAPEAGTVAELAASALASSALAAARSGGRAWREVPVVVPVEDRLVEGFVDLLHEAGDGSLVVVDWKTDRARSEAEVDAALDRYRLQGAAYAVAVAEATGLAVSAVRFVFCRAGGQPAVEGEIAGDELAAAEADVRARLRTA